MDIRFKNKKLRELCEQQRVAQRDLGADSARKLNTRLGELEAAANVAELVAGNPHPLDRDRKGQYAVNLAGGARLVFVPENDPCPTNDDQSINWSQVTIIKIEYIGDYHD